MKSSLILVTIGAALTFLVGCSGAQKAREVQREKLSQSSGFFCEFINGDDFKDIDIELNLSLAKRCDSSKSFSTTYYKNSSDVYGVLYCCSLAGKKESKAELPAMKIEGEKHEDKPAASISVPKPEKPSKVEKKAAPAEPEEDDGLSAGTKSEPKK